MNLSNAAAGSLSTAISGAVTSAYTATVTWTARATVAKVDVLLASPIFTPAANKVAH